MYIYCCAELCYAHGNRGYPIITLMLCTSDFPPFSSPGSRTRCEYFQGSHHFLTIASQGWGSHPPMGLLINDPPPTPRGTPAFAAHQWAMAHCLRRAALHTYICGSGRLLLTRRGKQRACPHRELLPSPIPPILHSQCWLGLWHGICQAFIPEYFHRRCYEKLECCSWNSTRSSWKGHMLVLYF